MVAVWRCVHRLSSSHFCVNGDKSAVMALRSLNVFPKLYTQCSYLCCRALATRFHDRHINPSSFESTVGKILSRVNVRQFNTSCLPRKEDKRMLIASMPRKDEGVEGEKSVDIDMSVRTTATLFPDKSTPDLLFEGTRFAELPICHIKVSKNNTLIHITDAKGKPILFRTCGAEGFSNAKKGTNIAAQATGISIGMKAVDQGLKHVRIKIQGLGPGRMASLKGLQMAGVEIVSITDNTPIPRKGPRPRKQRRL